MKEENKFSLGLSAAIPPKSGLSSVVHSGLASQRSQAFQGDDIFHRLTEAIEMEQMSTESPTIR